MAEPGTTPAELGRRVLDALAASDMTALRRCLETDVELLVLQPDGLRRRRGRPAVVDTFAGWFAAPGDAVEVLHRRVEVLGGQVALSYRMRIVSPTTADVVEQHLYGTPNAGRLTSLRLLCSGFLTEPMAKGVTS